MSSEVEFADPPSSKDKEKISLLDLPNEMIMEILLYLEPSEVAEVRQTCKRLQTVCNDEYFASTRVLDWRELSNTRIRLCKSYHYNDAFQYIIYNENHRSLYLEGFKRMSKCLKILIKYKIKEWFQSIETREDAIRYLVSIHAILSLIPISSSFSFTRRKLFTSSFTRLEMKMAKYDWENILRSYKDTRESVILKIFMMIIQGKYSSNIIPNKAISYFATVNKCTGCLSFINQIVSSINSLDLEDVSAKLL